jgi:hypothetical protein
MTGRLSNESIKSFLLKRIIKEYRKFIVGANNKLLDDSHLINNSFNFFFENGLTNLVDEKTSFLGQFINTFKFAGPLDDNDKDMEVIRDNYIFDMLDNNYGAFFLKDIKSGNAFTNKWDSIDKSKYFTILHEPEFGYNHDYFDSSFSVKKLVSSIKKENITDIPDANNTKPKQVNVVNKKDETVQKSLSFKATKTNLWQNQDLNKNPKGLPSRLEPSLGAIVIKKHGLGLPAKNSEHLNIFFNAITAIEMSRCTPFIDIAVVTSDEENLPKNINNVTFMRFIKKSNSDGDLVLDENVGIKTGNPFGFKDSFGIDEYDLDNNPNISLMDIFSSPQVMANANVNKDIKYTKGIYGNEILEPIAPLLSLSDLSIDISGMGIALFSSKVGSINLKLHDRSRLTDISHLVSPKSFGTTKLIIEFGWSHPEGNLANDNIIGQFLNACRDRSVYTVKSTNFSFSDSNIVNIGLALACYGQQQSTNISSAVGRKVPLNTFKAGIRKILEDFEKTKLVGEALSDKLKIKEVRNIHKVELKNTTSNTNLIDFKAYSKLVEKYKKYKKSPNNPLIRGEIDEQLKIIAFPEDMGIGTGLDPVIAADRKKKQKESIVSLMNEKLYALKYHDDSCNLLQKKYLVSFNKEKITFNDDKNNNAESLNNNLPNPEEFVPLGKVFMSFIGHPLAMSGMFDEVQMIFYPLNLHSGGASIHTTASMPIEFSLLQSTISERIKSSTNLSVKGFFNLIEGKIIRDRSLTVYSINPIIRTYTTAKDAIKKDKAYTDALKAKKRLTESLSADKGDISAEAFNKDKYAEAVNILQQTSGLATDGEKSAAKETINSIQTQIKHENSILTEKFKAEVAPHEKTIKATLDRIAEQDKKQRKDLVKHLKDIYKKLDGGLREGKFIRPNLSLYMETLTERDPSSTVTGSPYDILSIVDGSYLNTLKSQLGTNAWGKHKGMKKNICRIHIYDEETSSNPRKQLIQSILTEGCATELINGDSNANINDIMKDYGLNSSAKIKNYVKNSYPSITYGANNSTVNGISITSNVSDQVSQVIQIASYARRNKQQSSASLVNDFEEITVVPASVNVRMMGNPLISRGNEIYIDFGTNTTLDNIYTVKSVSHNISSGKFETNVSLIYSGQGDTKSIAGDIQRVLEKEKKLLL